MTGIKAPAALIDELGIADPADLLIEAIAQYVGATVIYEPLHGCAARIVGYRERAIITVDSSAPRPRQRFSAAHELGHWMRDRGRIAFSCKELSFLREWRDENPERRANRYAADLLLPRKLFEPAARGTDAVFNSVRELARIFETSLTSTAIRLAEVGDIPVMLVCSSARGREWFFRSSLLPDAITPLAMPGPGTIAHGLFAGQLSQGPETVDADDWIDHPDARTHCLIEDSIGPHQGLVLSLLWWKDESQLLEIDDDDAEDPRPLDGMLSFRGRGRR